MNEPTRGKTDKSLNLCKFEYVWHATGVLVNFSILFMCLENLPYRGAEFVLGLLVDYCREMLLNLSESL